MKPLPTASTGRKFELRNKVVGVYDKGKAGSVVESEQSIVDKETGEVYSKTVSTAFFVGQGNWGGPKGMVFFSFILWTARAVSLTEMISSGPSSASYPPPRGKNPDAVYVVQTTPETAHLYR